MKAFLLAGGRGERLRPLTLQVPKCLVPVRGVPLLERWLRACEREGIEHVFLNVSQHAELVERFLEERPAGSVPVRLVKEPEPLGTAGTVLANRGFVDGEETFWVIYSDNLTDMTLAPMLDCHRSHDSLLTMALFRTDSPRSAGIVELDEDGWITSFSEKPAAPRSNLANAGLYLVRRPVLDLIPSGLPLADFGHHVLPALIGRMHGYVVPGFYADIGTPAALARAEAAWADMESRSGEVVRDGSRAGGALA